MGRQQSNDRKAAKARSVALRIREVAPQAELLTAMLDETKLDLLLLALGIGEVQITESAQP